MELAALPTDLLQRCFAGASLADRCALACTCRRLAAITAASEPGFWQAIELDLCRLKSNGSGGLAVALAFLAKRVSRSTRLRLSCAAASQKPGSPPAGEHGDWARLLLPLLMGVGINPGLAGLDLDLRGVPLALQADVLAALPWLVGLRSLRLSGVLLADGAQIGALAKLGELEALQLHFNPQAAAVMGCALQGGLPARLSGLGRLRQLAITGAGKLGDVPEALGELSSLRSLELGGGTLVSGLPASLSRLAALSRVVVEQAGRRELACLAALPDLRELNLACARLPLELAGCSQLTALTLLLADVAECEIETGFSRMLGFTPPPLELRAPPSAPGGRSLGQQLRVLHVRDTKLGSVPQAVAQLRRLEHLSFTRCQLFDLPPGPYTQRLQTLRLKHNFFIEVPRGLAGGAPRLRALDLSHNLLRPSEADADTVLALPALRHLWVAKTAPLPGPERFRQGLTGWTAYAMDCLFRLAAAHAAQHPGRPLAVHVFEPSPRQL